MNKATLAVLGLIICCAATTLAAGVLAGAAVFGGALFIMGVAAFALESVRATIGASRQ